MHVRPIAKWPRRGEAYSWAPVHGSHDGPKEGARIPFTMQAMGEGQLRAGNCCCKDIRSQSRLNTD